MQSKAKFKPESEPPAPEWITLRGMVTDGDTGLPLAGAVVSGTTTEGTTYKTKASDLGEYKVLLDKAPKVVRAAFEKGGTESDVEGTSKETSISIPYGPEDIVINLQVYFLRRFTISGTVRDNAGVPIPDVWLQVQPQRSGGNKRTDDIRVTAKSETDGTFKLVRRLPIGMFEIHANKDGYKSSTASFELGQWFRGIVVPVDLQMAKLPVITGTVRAGGQVVRGANVVVTIRSKTGDTEEASSISETTDEVGHFVAGLTDHGNVSIGVTHPLYPTFKKNLGHTDHLPPSTNIDVDFDKLRRGQYFRGQITDPEGKPIVPKQVYLLKSIKSVDDPESSIVLPVGSNGTFEVVLEPGADYFMIVYADGFEKLVHKDVTSENISSLSFRLKSNKK